MSAAMRNTFKDAPLKPIEGIKRKRETTILLTLVNYLKDRTGLKRYNQLKMGVEKGLWNTIKRVV